MRRGVVLQHHPMGATDVPPDAFVIVQERTDMGFRSKPGEVRVEPTSDSETVPPVASAELTRLLEKPPVPPSFASAAAVVTPAKAVQPEPAPVDRQEPRRAPKSPRRWRPVDRNVPVIRERPLPPPPIIRGIYNRLGMTVALFVAGTIGTMMWYFASGFTLDYLHTVPAFAAFFGKHWLQWLVPIGMSAAELFLWPQREYRLRIWALRMVLWLIVLGFDIVTTNFGVSPWILSWTWNTWIQDTTQLPYRSIWNTLVGLEIGLAFAYLPEKIVRWVLTDLWSMWAAPIWNWYKKELARRTAEAELAA